MSRKKDYGSWSSGDEEPKGEKTKREMRSGDEEKISQGGKYEWKNRAILRYGRIGIKINEQCVSTIKLEKSYGGILNGNSATLLREYMEELVKIVDPMGHIIILVPYNNGEFATGILDASSMALMEEEEKSISIIQKGNQNSTM